MKKNVLMFMLSIFVITLFAQEEINTNKDSKELPEIYFNETTHDFGVIEYDGNGVFEFEFENIGKQPLILTNVRSSCGCATPVWPKQPVKKGEKGTITVKYNTKLTGKFTKTIKVYSNGKTPMITLTIKGEVRKSS